MFVYVCLCSDNSINQRLISKMLSRLGFNTHQFRLTADGQSAAEEIQRANVLVAAAAPASLSTSSSVQSLQLLVGQSSSASSSHSGDRDHDADSHSPAVSTCDSSNSSVDGLSFSPRGQWHGALGGDPASSNSNSNGTPSATATQRAVGSGAIGSLTADVGSSGPAASLVLPPAAAAVVSPNCYDLVLMDLQMPICDGFEVMQRSEAKRSAARSGGAAARFSLAECRTVHALLHMACRSLGLLCSVFPALSCLLPPCSFFLSFFLFFFFFCFRARL